MTNREMPSWQQLIDWLEGRLSSEETERVQQQIDHADASLRADVDWIRAFLQSRETIILDEPPADLRVALRGRGLTKPFTRKAPPTKRLRMTSMNPVCCNGWRLH